MNKSALFLAVLTAVKTGYWVQGTGPSQDLYAQCRVIQSVSGYPIEGTIKFKQLAGSTTVTVTGSLTGFSTTDNTTEHGFHVHQNGSLANNCSAAGPHFNPDNTLHGAPQNRITDRHVGDLGNVNEVNGTATINITDSIIQLVAGNQSIIGKALVIHSDPDDLGLGGKPTSNTTGNAGSRIGCCLIEADTNHGPQITAALQALVLQVLGVVMLKGFLLH